LILHYDGSEPTSLHTSENIVAYFCYSSPRIRQLCGDMLWYMDNFIFILIFVYFRCVVLCSLINITVSTVHLKLLITAVCANIPAKTATSSAFKNLFVNSVDYFVPPDAWLDHTAH